MNEMMIILLYIERGSGSRELTDVVLLAFE